VRKEKVEALRDDVLRVVRENRLGSPAGTSRQHVEFALREGVDRRSRCTSCASCRSRSAASQRHRAAHGRRGRCRQRRDPADATEPRSSSAIAQAVEQSIQILETRLNDIGTVEPSIQRQGVDRILVQVPGSSDPQQILDISTRPPSWNSAWSISRCRRAGDPTMRSAGLRTAPARKASQPAYLIEKRVIVSGETSPTRSPGFDHSEPASRSSASASTPVRARRFAQVTQENVGQAVRHRARQRGDFSRR
jgi:preprotein translocase subunit SecD